MRVVSLSFEQQLTLYYWMRLTRTFDDAMVALWKQGRGVGGTFSQRGHEALSVGSASALLPSDFIAPMHRDLGAYLLRGLSPRRIFANLLARESGITRGRDANLHGLGDLSLNLLGFISHLPDSLPVALGAAMAFQYRSEPHVALVYVGDGSSSAGLFHETLNLAAVQNAPLVVILENNQYAYSTPLSQQTRNSHFVERAATYGIPGARVDGNDVLAVREVTQEAAERARGDGGPTLIEAVTMRMMGHAIHDGADYVPPELLAEWEERDPLRLYEQHLMAESIADPVELDEIGFRCQTEVADAIAFAEASPMPDAATVSDGVYAE